MSVPDFYREAILYRKQMNLYMVPYHNRYLVISVAEAIEHLKHLIAEHNQGFTLPTLSTLMPLDVALVSSAKEPQGIAIHAFNKEVMKLYGMHMIIDISRTCDYCSKELIRGLCSIHDNDE